MSENRPKAKTLCEIGEMAEDLEIVARAAWLLGGGWDSQWVEAGQPSTICVIDSTAPDLADAIGDMARALHEAVARVAHE